MTLFTFGQVSLQYLYPLLLSLSCYSQFFSFKKYIEQKGDKTENNVRSLTLVNCLLDVISLLFCGILALVSYFCIRKKKYKCSAIFKQNKCSTLFFHFCGYSFINLSTFATNFLYNDISSVFIELTKSIQIIFCILICFLLLKIKNYKHHYLSIIISFLASIGIFILKWIYFREEKDTIKNMFSLLPHYFSYSMMEAYEKYIMQNLYFPPYLVLFFKGIIGLFLYVFACPVIYSINKEMIDVAFFSLKSSLKSKWLYLLLISCFLLNIFRMLTIHFYNPIYRYVADILVLLYLFIEVFPDYNQGSPIFVLIIYGILLLIILFSILVYQEIIIINVWGLDKNTSKQIIKRATTDFNNDALNINKSLESIQSINEEDLVPERE